MNILNKITQRSFTLRTMLRTGAVTLGIGVIIGACVAIVGMPVVETALAAFEEKWNPEIVYVAPEKVVEAPTLTGPEAYYQEYYLEEKDKLTKKYEEALESEAKNNAIERVKEELELEQEKIREQELF